jgi:hypothetical protein
LPSQRKNVNYDEEASFWRADLRQVGRLRGVGLVFGFGPVHFLLSRVAPLARSMLAWRRLAPLRSTLSRLGWLRLASRRRQVGGHSRTATSARGRGDAGSGDPARHLGADRRGLRHLRARARRAEPGRGSRPISERAIHTVADLRMLIGGAVAACLGPIAILASLSG